MRLQNGGWEAEIAPELGGSPARLEYEGAPVLRTPEQAADRYLFGSPVLLPANRTRAGMFSFAGRAYRLPINEPASNAHLHGLVCEQRFIAREQSRTSAVLFYESAREVYPFPFRLTLYYKLGEQGLRTEYLLENTGGAAMPFTFGLHTTFVAPDFFCVPLAEEQERAEDRLPTGRYVPLSAAQRRYAEGTDPRGQAISGYFRARGHVARVGDFLYRVSPLFDHWVLYNAGGNAGLLCVEPQLGAVDGLNLPGGFRVLERGESIRLHTEILFAPQASV